jgi:hypothetical protein
MIVITGCTSTSKPSSEIPVQPSPSASPTAAMTVPATTPTQVPPTTSSPVTTTGTVKETMAAHADPTDVSQIRFVHYSDSDFAFDYPSTWNVSAFTYTPYFCKSTEMIRCYQAELKTIGPFDFNENSFLKKTVAGYHVYKCGRHTETRRLYF